MKRRFAFVITYWWCLLLGIAGALPFVFGDPAGGISESENRTLAPLPAFSLESWFDGSFSPAFEAYIADQLPARDRLLDGSSRILALFSAYSEEERLLQTDVGKQIDSMGGADEAAESTAEEPTVPTGPTAADPAGTAVFSDDADIPLDETVPPDGGEAPASAGTAKLAYRLNDGAEQTIFQFGELALSGTARTLNAYRAALPADGRVTFLYVPYSQVANEWLFHPDKYAGWFSTAEPALQALCDEGIYVCPAVNLLGEHLEQGEAVYFKTDHHWSPLGASYAQRDVRAHFGTPVADYDDYDYTVHESFTGSIAQAARAFAGASVTDRLEIPAALAPTRALVYRNLNVLMKEVRYMETERKSYGAILGGTHSPFYVAETGFHTGRNALIICDSYGNAFLPYLTPYYDRVCLADLRKTSAFGSMGGASIRTYIEHYGIDDVYFVVSTGCGINSGYMRQTVYDYLG